jgi:hypothetical protein
MTEDSFEERFSLKLSRLNIFTLVGCLVFFSFLSAVLLITTTPLTEYIPGKATSEVQKDLITLTIKYDSVMLVLESQNTYLKNIISIVNGGELVIPDIIETSKGVISEINFEKSLEDSLLRVDVESEDRGAIRTFNKDQNEILLFFPPLNGFITDGFDPQKEHFGIDLVAKEKTRISAVLEGTVIVSNWTSETGYVIGIQHKNDYFSFYKHNSVLLKSVGDFVNAGDPIAIIGNSGELSSGPHLHFELWRNGIPVSPENYILF